MKVSVLIDTNVFISALLSESSISKRVLDFIIECQEQDLMIAVASTHTKYELDQLIENKFEAYFQVWTKVISEKLITWIEPPEGFEKTIPYIRDEDDIPILAAACYYKPTVLITGDKDFYTDEIEAVITPMRSSDFLFAFQYLRNL